MGNEQSAPAPPPPRPIGVVFDDPTSPMMGWVFGQLNVYARESHLRPFVYLAGPDDLAAFDGDLVLYLYEPPGQNPETINRLLADPDPKRHQRFLIQVDPSRLCNIVNDVSMAGKRVMTVPMIHIDYSSAGLQTVIPQSILWHDGHSLRVNSAQLGIDVNMPLFIAWNNYIHDRPW